MTHLPLLALAIATGQGCTVASYLEAKASSGPAYICHIPLPYDQHSKFESPAALLSSLHILDEFRTSVGSGMVWDSTSLFPGVWSPENERRSHKQLTALLRLFQQLKSQVSQAVVRSGPNLDGQGLPLATANPGVIEQLRQFLANSGVQPPPEISQEALLRMDTSVHVCFKSTDDRRRYFALKPNSVVHLRLKASREEEKRVPSILWQALGSAPITFGTTTKVVPLNDAVRLLQEHCSQELMVDQRVGLDHVYIHCPNRSISPQSFASLLARSMDMYWRPLGPVFELACAPGEPRALQRIRMTAQRTKQRSAIAKILEDSGMLPSGISADDVDAGASSLADLTPAALISLQSGIDFQSDEQRQEFEALLQDPSFLNGTIEMGLTGMLTVEIPSTHIDIGYTFDLRP